MTRERRWRLTRVWTTQRLSVDEERDWAMTHVTDVEPWACGFVLITPWMVIKLTWWRIP